jgi:PrtD family type I secretion system ABC transporter
MASAQATTNDYKRVARKIRRGLAVVAGFSVLTNLLMLTAPVYTLLVFDKVLSSGQPATLLYLSLIALVALATMGLLEAVRGRLLARLGTELEHRLSPELLRATVAASLKGVPTSSQPLRDLASVRGFLGTTQVTAMLDAPWVPFFVLVLALLHPWLGLVGAGAAVLLFLVALLNEVLTRKPLSAATRAALGGTQRLEFALRNAEAIRAMGMYEALRARWTADTEESLKGQLRAADAGAAINGFSRFVRLVAQVAVLGLGAYLVLGNQLTAGGMIAGSILLGRALAPVEQSLGSWRSFANARAAWRRLRALAETCPAEPKRMRLPEPAGVLSLQDVWFSPNGRTEPTLSNVSFELKPGNALGIVGPSGAGKSTLCKLLIGVWTPTRGAVRLDDAEVHHWDSAQLGRHVGYLPQDVELFEGSVKDNIARMDPEADPKEILAAAQAAGVHEFVLSLPDAYETEIGPGGCFLSGGQRQRIGLARALYGQPKLLVLDEPHASLDGAGETDLLNAIEAAKAWGASIVLVAHRPAILKPAENLLILQDGRARALGPREEILALLRGSVDAPEPAPPAEDQRPAARVERPVAFGTNAAAILKRASRARRAGAAGGPAAGAATGAASAAAAASDGNTALKAEAE